MSYSQDFSKKYESYLNEPNVRIVHNFMFRNFKYFLLMHNFNVIEFGCGQSCEFLKFGDPLWWYGFDENPPELPMTFACDYTKITKNELIEKVKFPINGFVSLFSTECSMSARHKYDFYRKMFSEYDLKVALVAGFYYKNKVKEELMESDGKVVYQTTENQKAHRHDEFIELRTEIEVPSETFGSKFVEVWKILIRKPINVN